MSFLPRIVIILLPAVAALVLLSTIPPIAQDPGYHQFADQRTLLGIPNFWNVVSNAPFLLVGVYGLRSIGRSRWDLPLDRYAWLVVAVASVLIGFGSGYYHLAPSNGSLFWDRLPMTLAFMGIFSAVIGEYIHARSGVILLTPLLFLGVFSVEVWRRSELAGTGDLRFYAIVQFYPMAALPLILWLFRPRYTHAGAMWGMISLYAVAKLLELLDGPILRWTMGLMSGHSLKHFAGAMALTIVFHALLRRTPVMVTKPQKYQ